MADVIQIKEKGDKKWANEAKPASIFLGEEGPKVTLGKMVVARSMDMSLYSTMSIPMQIVTGMCPKVAILCHNCLAERYLKTR